MAASHVRDHDEEVLAVLRESDDPIVTATEVAGKLGMTRQGSNYRLKQLEKEGVIKRRKVGSRAVVWWLAT